MKICLIFATLTIAAPVDLFTRSGLPYGRLPSQQNAHPQQSNHPPSTQRLHQNSNRLLPTQPSASGLPGHPQQYLQQPAQPSQNLQHYGLPPPQSQQDSSHLLPSQPSGQPREYYAQRPRRVRKKHPQPKPVSRLQRQGYKSASDAYKKAIHPIQAAIMHAKLAQRPGDLRDPYYWAEARHQRELARVLSQKDKHEQAAKAPNQDQAAEITTETPPNAKRSAKRSIDNALATITSASRIHGQGVILPEGGVA